MTLSRIFSRMALLGLLAAPLSADTVTTFANGPDGWTGPSTLVEVAGGNPDHNLRTTFNDFGIIIRNNTNLGFVMDYSASSPITISVDLKVEDISSIFSGPTARPFLVELRDFDNAPAGYPYTSVWYKWDDISQAQYGNWTTLSVTISDATSAALPPGWGGYGAENAQTFEPELPANRTFTDVLASMDELVFTTLEPGWFFTAVDFDFRLDNIRVSTEPGVASCYGVGCPCGNDDANAGCANSTGTGAMLSGVNTTSVTSDDLMLSATGLPTGQQGLFYMGDTQVQAPLWDGLQCALGTSYRFLNSTQNSGEQGRMSYTGLVGESSGLITVGSTWHFHCWHRDVTGVSPCGTGANFSNLYSVTFTP
jgi:hypothetical protein